MAEWSIAPVLKTGNPQGFVSSNLTASARFTRPSPLREGLLFGNHFAHPWSLRRGVLPVYSAHSMPHTPVPQRPFTVRSWWAGLLAVCTLLLMVACSSTKTPTATPQAAKPKTPASAPSARAPAPKAAAPAAIRLLRPAAGPVVDRFDGSRNKGIDIGGKAGDAILAAEAGLRTVNIGPLLGLAEPRREMFFTGLHARFLETNYLQTEVAVSLPRINEAEGGFSATQHVGDRLFVQLMTALRVFLPRAGITLSTRERAAFRDRLMAMATASHAATSARSKAVSSTASSAMVSTDATSRRIPRGFWHRWRRQ